MIPKSRIRPFNRLRGWLHRSKSPSVNGKTEDTSPLHRANMDPCLTAYVSLSPTKEKKPIFPGVTTDDPQSIEEKETDVDMNACHMPTLLPISATPPTMNMFNTFEGNEAEAEAVSIDASRTLTSGSTIPHITEDSVLLPHALTRDISNKSSLKAVQSATHILKLHLVGGKDLVIRDSSGTSDPYVKIRHNGVSIARSRIIHKQLNPMWNEIYHIPLQGLDSPIELRIYDHDTLGRDDYMGRTLLYLEAMTLDETQEFHLTLEDETGKSTENYLGMLHLFCCITLSDKPSLAMSSFQIDSGSSISNTNTAAYLSCDPLSMGASLTDSKPNLIKSSARRKRQEFAVSASTNSLLSDNVSTCGSSRQFSYYSPSGTSTLPIRGRRNAPIAVVTLIVISAENLLPLELDNNTSSNPYIKFRLGKESCRTKAMKKTCNPQWNQHFSLQMWENSGSLLEFRVYSNEVTSQPFLGRGSLDLSKLSPLKAHVLSIPLEDGAGLLRIQISVNYNEELGGSGLSSTSSASVDGRFQRDTLLQRYSLKQTFADMNDVGWLQIKVVRAENLMAKDLNGKSDPFCVIQLVNERVQTRTEYKTLNPDWNEQFQFEVRDIHEQLEVTLYDEDKDKRDFLGRVEIPLLKIRNGERRWYALRNEKLTRRTRGAVLLEMHFIYNHVRAAVKTLEPKDSRDLIPEAKVSISTLRQNIDRIRFIVDAFILGFQFLDSCWSWKSPSRTIIAFLLFLIIVWNFQLYMLPFTLILLFLKAMCFQALGNKFATRLGTRVPRTVLEESYFPYEEEEEEKIEKEKSPSMMEYYYSVRDVLIKVQDTTDAIASIFERIHNLFLWEVPWLSCLAIILLLVITFILYWVPLRWLVLAWGVNKFTKKLLRPHALDNFEPLDLLSRVPSYTELVKWRDFKNDIYSSRSTAMTSPSPTITNKKKS